MEKQKENYLKSINCFPWKKAWEEKGGNLSAVARVSDTSIITIGLILTLYSFFSSDILFHRFLLQLLPVGTCLIEGTPFFNLLAKLITNKKKLVKNGARDAKKLAEFLNLTCIDDLVAPSSHPTVSSPSCNCASTIGLLTTQMKTLGLEKNMLINKTTQMETLGLEKDKLISKLRSDLASAQFELEKAKANLENSKLSLTSSSRQIAGFKSGQKRRRLSEEKSASTTHLVDNRQFKCRQGTDCLGYVRVTKSFDSPNVFEGIFEPCHVGTENNITAKPRQVFYNLGATRKSNSTVGESILLSRVSLAMRILGIISGCLISDVEKDKINTDEVEFLLVRIARRYASMFKNAAVSIGMTFLRIMSPEEGVNLRSLLRLPTASFRTLRIILSNMGYKFLPSERKMRVVQAQMTHHLDEAAVSVDDIYLVLSKKDGEVKMGMVPVLFCRNLEGYVQSVLRDLKLKTAFDDPDMEISVLFSGDKGGGFMKFHFEVITCSSPSSVFDVHIFSMYEASDCAENMAKVLGFYEKSILRMQEGGYCIDGHTVKVLFGGDFKFQDACLGTQGSTAKFPSNKDYVTLDHLQNHGNKPHTPEHCNIEIRTVGEIEAHYQENLCEDRGQDLHATGKFHGSVVQRACFPIISLENVVPPVLHIMLGIVLKLFNLLEAHVQELDLNDGHKRDKKITNELQKKIKGLQVLEEKIKHQGMQFIDFYNFSERLEAKLSGNEKDLDAIASSSDNTRSAKAVQNEACQGILCLISRFDSEVFWIECNTCEAWVHGLCEVMSSVEQLRCKKAKSYDCLRCSGKQESDLEFLVKSKIDSCRATQVDIEQQARVVKDEVRKLEAEVEKTMGPLERALIGVLDTIKVERQAYHSNSFVGNHCRKILKNHELLCGVISNYPFLHAKFLTVFSIYAEIQPFLSSKQILSPADISKVVTLCTRFGEEFPVCFPEETITRKMHELVFNVPRFLRLHKTIGLYSEEEGESLHNSVNQELRQLYCVRDGAQKMSLLLRRQELRGKADRSLSVPQARKCRHCSDEGKKSFFVNGVCPLCKAEQ